MNEEIKVLEKTAELWNLIIKLPEMHPDDIAEHRRDVHNIQNRIAARMYFKTTSSTSQ